MYHRKTDLHLLDATQEAEIARGWNLFGEFRNVDDWRNLQAYLDNLSEDLGWRFDFESNWGQGQNLFTVNQVVTMFSDWQPILRRLNDGKATSRRKSTAKTDRS